MTHSDIPSNGGPPPTLPRRVSSVTFQHASTQPKSSRVRSASTANHGPYPTANPMIPSISLAPAGPILPARNHSSSISSVESATLTSIIQQDSNPYHNIRGIPGPHKKQGKIKLMEDIDIEKQLIITAGGKREDVLAFIFKLLFLMAVVFGSGVLIFYAL